MALSIPYTAKTLLQEIVSEVSTVYEENEAKAIAYLLVEHFCGITKMDILLNNPVTTTVDWSPILSRIKAQEPVQYLIGETEFYGRMFSVSQATLIPRPETEELVAYVCNHAIAQEARTVLDIGTGSGCIAISLACELPQAQVYAYDVSEDALAMAKQNALRNKVPVNFEQHDILQTKTLTPSSLDIIVSNPPYVKEEEMATMKQNVLDYEPYLALFVSDDNPLLFYKVIAHLAGKHLRPNGLCMVEINEQLGEETAALFTAEFYDIEVIKDLFGKDRFVKAVKK